jgi:hypothetical protein
VNKSFRLAEEELVPLLQRSPALIPITLLEDLQQQQKSDMDWLLLERALQRRVRMGKTLHG